MDLRSLRRQITHVAQDATPLLAQLHHGAEVFGWRDDRGQHHRFLNPVVGSGRRHLRRVVDDDLLLAPADRELDVWRRGDELQPELALQTLLHDVHVEQPEESAPEPEPQRQRRLRFVDERRVGQLELVQCVTKQRIVAAVRRVEPAPHHGLGLAVPG